MLGRLRSLGQETAPIFSGAQHAPAPVSDADLPYLPTDLASLDCPDWLAPRLRRSLDVQFEPVMRALQHRAKVFLRVNLARITPAGATAMLAEDGIEVLPHPLANASLEVLTTSRKLLITKAYLSGLVELQDVSSQAVTEAIPLSKSQKVLDYCAGGGGKTLALAARQSLQLFAHDANPTRMRDLPERARRAGVTVTQLADPGQHAPYDLVLVDAPCSGSGSWRRDPQGKWALSEDRFAELTALQAGILRKASPLVAPQGLLVYVTCSLLADENQDQIATFLRHSPEWCQLEDRHFTTLDGGDGFYFATLRRRI